MIKKLSLLVLLLATILLTTTAVYASDTSDEESYHLFDYYPEADLTIPFSPNNVTTIKNRMKITFDYIDFNINTMIEYQGNTYQMFYDELSLISNGGTEYPDRIQESYVSIWATDTATEAVKTLYFDYSDITQQTLRLYDEYGNIEDLSDYQDMYFTVSIASKTHFRYFGGSEYYDLADALMLEFLENPKDYFDVTVYKTSEYDTTLTLEEQILLLPETDGSIFDDVNEMGNVSYTVNDYDVSFRILYNEVYYLDYTFDLDTDMTIFDNSFESFYYSYDGQKFIVINHGEQSMFTARDIKEQTFVPYTIWNLDTNEIVTYEKASVYIYLTAGAGGHINGYFYTDEFIIDNLMSVSLLYDYRYDPLIGKKSDWITESIILENDAMTDPSVSWQATAAATSISATAVLTGIAAVIPGGQPLAFGIFLVGSAVNLYLTYAVQEAGHEMYVRSTNEIVPYEPSDDFRDEVNEAYISTNQDFEGLDLDTYQMFKLDLGDHDKFGNTVEVNDETIEVIEMVYETNGKVYTLEHELIETYADVDAYLDKDNDSTLVNPGGTNPSNGFNLPDNLGIYILGAAAIIIFGKPILKKAQKEPIFGLILLGGVVYLLYYFGLISI